MGVPAGRHPARRPVGFWCPGLRPGTRCKARATTTAKAAAGIPDLAGRCGLAGHAVNPSLGARWRLARVRCPAHTARPGLGVLPNPPEACLGPMPRTLPQPDPPRLRQFPAICRRSTPCVDESLSKSNISRIERRASTHRVDLPCRPRSTPTHSRGNLSEVGRCGAAGPLAPWMAPSSPHGRVYGVSCSPAPSRQTISNPEPLWLWPLLVRWPLQVQGAALPPPPPQELQDSIEQPARLSAHAGRLPAKCSSPARSVYGSRSTSCSA